MFLVFFWRPKKGSMILRVNKKSNWERREPINIFFETELITKMVYLFLMIFLLVLILLYIIYVYTRVVGHTS